MVAIVFFVIIYVFIFRLFHICIQIVLCSGEELVLYVIGWIGFELLLYVIYFVRRSQYRRVGRWR